MPVPTPGSVRRQVFDAMHAGTCGPQCHVRCQTWRPSEEELDAAVQAYEESGSKELPVYYALESRAVEVFALAATAAAKEPKVAPEYFGHMGRALHTYSAKHHMPTEGLGIVCFQILSLLCDGDQTAWSNGRSRDEIVAKFREAEALAAKRSAPYQRVDE